MNAEIKKEIQKHRDILKKNVTPSVGKTTRLELNVISKMFYTPKHTLEQYMNWIEENMPIFRLVANQNQNQPFYMQMFTVKSQFVYGDSTYECLDKAMKS